MSENHDVILSSDDYQNKERSLFELLKRLSKNSLTPDECDQYISELCTIYSGRFRHMYSRFYSFVISLEQVEREILSSNLSEIFIKTQAKMRSGEKVDEDAYNCIAKLYDHINIELSRVDEANKHSDTEKKLETSLLDKEKRLEEINRSMNDVSERFEKSTTDIISVLGIFSAIVMVFFGGFNYVSNAITTLSSVSLCKAAIVSLVAGFLFLNTIVSLMYMIARITGKSIFSSCTKTHLPSCDGCKEKCGLIRKIKREMPFVFFVYVMIFALLVLFSVYYKREEIVSLFRLFVRRPKFI